MAHGYGRRQAIPAPGRDVSLALPSLVDLFYAICQGLGLALATGLGGVIVPLFAAVLAHVDIGWSLDGTGWEFVGSEWFVALLFALNVAWFVGRRRDLARPLVLAALVTLGAILFAASLAEDAATAWPGLIIGAAAAAGAALIAHDVLGGAARRAGVKDGPGADSGLLGLAALAGVVLVAASVFFPPLSILALAGLIALVLTRRRAGGRKFAGLRILR